MNQKDQSQNFPTGIHYAKNKLLKGPLDKINLLGVTYKKLASKISDTIGTKKKKGL